MGHYACTIYGYMTNGLMLGDFIGCLWILCSINLQYSIFPKCPKAVPRHFQTMYCGHGSSTKCYFNNFYSCGSSHMIKSNKPTVMSIRNAMVSLFVLSLPSREGFWNDQSHNVTWSIRCHVGIHVDFTSILHSNTQLVLQEYCEAADLFRICLLHQWECLKCNGHGPSVSCLKWP